MLKPIVEAVRQAATLTSRVQQHYIARLAKAGQEPVTIADYGVQAILCRAIGLAFPDDAIIAEESAAEFSRTLSAEQQLQVAGLVGAVIGEAVTVADIVTWLDSGCQRSAEATWVIDPIDGTRGFLEGRRYVIGVGLLENGCPMGAVIGLPSDDMLLYAWDGIAYAEPLTGGSPHRIYTAERSGPSVRPTTNGVFGWGVEKALGGVAAPAVERVDAQLEHYALIARGDADIFICGRCSSKIWDHVAGVALVEAAGGRVTDFHGQPLDFSKGTHVPQNNVVVSNGRIHQDLLAVMP